MNKEENINISFEDAIEKLEKIVKDLESGECPLDEAIDKYTEGMKLVKFCGDKLNSATEKVNKIYSENGELKDFSIPDSE